VIVCTRGNEVINSVAAPHDSGAASNTIGYDDVCRLVASTLDNYTTDTGVIELDLFLNIYTHK